MVAGTRGDPAATDGGIAPGEHLRAEIERLGLDQVAVSQATGVSRQSINNIVNGRQPISRAMAAKLGRLTGHGSDYWLRASFPGQPSTREPAAGPFGVCILVDHQIIRVVRDGIVGVDPFDETRVQLASLDLTLDDFVIAADGERIDISAGHSFPLRAGQAVGVSTKEWLEFPHDYVGRVGALAQLARTGIITSHGFQIAPGFKGNLQFYLFNAGTQNFALRGGDAIISLEIMPLNGAPTQTASAPRHMRDADNRESCRSLIDEAVRAHVKTETTPEGAKARLDDLDIEIIDASAASAIEDAVRSALSSLKLLRANPRAARAEYDRYARFFGELAERLHLSGHEARHAIAALGLLVESGDSLMVTLRDGTETIVAVPSKSAKVSLRHLARQLREDPLDLIGLLWAGGAAP